VRELVDDYEAGRLELAGAGCKSHAGNAKRLPPQ